MKNFIIKYLSITILLLTSIAIFNYFVDPSHELYKKKLFLKGLGQYADQIINADKAVRLLGPARMIRYELIKYHKDFDCIIFSSSHAMQVSNLHIKSLKNICHKTLNLGVSAAGFHDFLIIYSKLIDVGYKGKLIIEISPWFFKKEFSSGYLGYSLGEDDEEKLLKRYPNYFSKSYDISSFEYKELISWDYFKESIRYFKKNITTPFSLPDSNPHLSKTWILEDGIEDGGIMNDGSHVYGITHEKIFRTDENYISNGNYNLNGDIYEEDVLNTFKEILNKQEVEIEGILLTPYHPNVFNEENEEFTKYFFVIENLLKTLGIKVFGSYNPLVLGCKANEFYDFGHARIACLGKINFD